MNDLENRIVRARNLAFSQFHIRRLAWIILVLSLPIAVGAMSSACSGDGDAARDMPFMTLAPCTNSTGVAFMGFDFDSKIDWDSQTNRLIDSYVDGIFLSREYELKPPFHGFETVEVRGDIISGKAYALIFDRHAVGELGMDAARRWAAEVRRDLAENCGINFAVEGKPAECAMSSGATDAIRIWICAGAFSTLRYDHDKGHWTTETGMEYQLQVRRK